MSLVCERCGGDTLKLIIFKTALICPTCRSGESGGERAHAVIDDTIIGGFWQENFGHAPEYFTSKRAMALRAKELRLEPFVRHQGVNGTDKSPHTTRWI